MDPFEPGDENAGDDSGDRKDPFANIPVFGDITRMFAQQGAPDIWSTARQFAQMVATDGSPEPNVDPLERIKIEQIARVAELHVTSLTGLVVPSQGVEPVTRGAWAERTLQDHRRYLEVLGDSLESTEAFEEPEEGDPMAIFAPLLRMAAPMMLGLSSGSMVGHLARRSFGQYDLPLPRQGKVMVIPANIDEFARDWSLEGDDLRLWVCLHELTFHTVYAVPHVRRRVEDLVLAYLAAFEPASGDLDSRLSGFDPTDPALASGGIPAAFSDPEILLGAARSPAQEAILPQLEAVLCVLVGYVDRIMDQAAGSLLPDAGRLAEAVRRHRVETGDAGRLVERLLGIELTIAAVERGRAFVSGVIERAGNDGLTRLFATEDGLPSPPEVDAPGLWLARLDLTSDSDGPTGSTDSDGSSGSSDATGATDPDAPGGDPPGDQPGG